MEQSDWYKENIRLIKESENLDMLFESIIEWASDGMTCDGSHHKRWYAQEILKMLDTDLVKNDFACPP